MGPSEGIPVTAAPKAPMNASPAIVRVTPALHVPAAAALVGRGRADAETTGRRFLEAAANHGIDLRNMWASVEPDGRGVRQVCLAVPGSGRTATVFTSTPGTSAQVDELARVIERTCDAIDGSCLAQALLEPVETLAMQAFARAKFERLADLAYLRRPTPSVAAAKRAPAPTMPEGIRLRSLAQGEAETLGDALDRTYTDTLDCPRLCELRTTDEVLDSHRAAGSFDPDLWWVIEQQSSDGSWRAEGVMLLTPCPSQGHIELVYLGLSPAARGKGISRPALEHGLNQCAIKTRGALRAVTCAVDRQNTPALRLYEKMGFREFAARVAYVQRTGDASAPERLAP